MSIDAARRYREWGLYVTPIPYGAKAPVHDGWQHDRHETEEDLARCFNGHPQNIGVLLSTSGVVDIDLDTEAARRLAPAFLPPTLTFGRASAPRSHWIYRTAERRQTRRYQVARETIVERRDLSSKGTPHQTVFPPSRHPSGEDYVFFDERPIAEVDADDLERRVGLLAAAVVFSRYWPRHSGARHDVARALASALLRAGLSVAEAEHFIRVVATDAGDPEVENRVETVAPTAEQLRAGGKATGVPTLLDLLADDEAGRKALSKALDWLGVSAPTSSAPLLDTAPSLSSDDSEPRADFDLSDLGNAERLVHTFGHDLRFSHEQESWLHFTGAVWAEDKTGAAPRMCYALVRRMQQEAVEIDDDARRSAAMKHARGSQSATKLRAMESIARNLIPVLAEELDSDPWLFNVANGTLDLRTRTLQPHDRAQLITKLAPVAYDPKATCPLWERTILDVCAGDAEQAGFLQRALGYSMTASTREQCIFILHGFGANGKGTVVNTVQSILGTYSQSMRPDLLMSKRYSGGASEGEAALRGARYVVTSETGSGQKFDEALVKRLTGGDKIRARFLHANEFEFEPTHKIWLLTNHKPAIEGTDYAIWRRIHLIPFTVTFTGDRADKTLDQRLRREAPGILNWLLEGCLKWQREGLQPPEAVVEATDQYRSEMDVLAGFLADCCELGIPEARVKANRLFQAFQAWCSRTGEQAGTATKFGLRLRERGIEKKRQKDGNHYVGVMLKPEEGA